MRPGGPSARIGRWLLVLIGACALAAPVLAPHTATEQFDNRGYAPPTRVHVLDGGIHAPFIHPLVLEDRLARRYREDVTTRIPLRWFSGGRLVSTDDPANPLMLFGGDSLGRDVFARVLYGAQLSLGVTLVGV